MKKKTLSDLLKKMEDAQIKNSDSITDLSDLLSKKMLKGGYDTNNGTCTGHNAYCENQSCSGTTNDACHNISCSG